MARPVKYKCELCLGRGVIVAHNGDHDECGWCDGQGAWDAGDSVTFATSKEFLAWLESGVEG